jgi:hypothetical protein
MVQSMSLPSPDPLVNATLTAVHRRDHRHPAEGCHPHQIEVVPLGRHAMAVCHDCCYEFGFDDSTSCEKAAYQHRSLTA